MLVRVFRWPITTVMVVITGHKSSGGVELWIDNDDTDLAVVTVNGSGNGNFMVAWIRVHSDGGGTVLKMVEGG
ncbi:hypothetical protein L1987_48778 [Smallanthus sonchifolius]|uniref:Uncharacterized protein n=1 Tax=Smallanthus sonchifolius TaxID=185202 RepID=A0ACB9FTD7_9ASTR|nr:hypothetical protein L1987_48778 [Smallanthus sonchifolius]